MKVEVHISRANNLKNVDDLAGWVDVMHKSSPYCQLVAGTAKVKTKDVDFNLDPVFDYVGTIDWDGSSPFVFTLLSEHMIKHDTFMGKATLEAVDVLSNYNGALKLEPQGELVVKTVCDQAFTVPAKGDMLELTSLMKAELFMWTSPVRSGLTLATIDLIFLAYYFLDFSPLAQFINLSLVAVVLGGILKFTGNRVLDTQSSEVIPKERIAASIASCIAVSCIGAQRLILWQSQKDSVKAFAALYFLRFISGVVSFPTVAFLATNLMFVVPVQLESQKALIDQQVMPMLTKARDSYKQLEAKIPKYSAIASKDD